MEGGAQDPRAEGGWFWEPFLRWGHHRGKSKMGGLWAFGDNIQDPAPRPSGCFCLLHRLSGQP